MKHHLAQLKSSGIRNYHHEYTWMKNQSPSPQTLDQWVEKRCQGKPLAYILKTMDFMDLSLFVDERVLIPRPETEIMVDHLISNITMTDQTIIDLGTGSGCIALSLKKAFPEKNIIGIDMEQGAIDVANINQKKHKDYKVEWVLANWLSAIDLSKVDVVIANPPYVETSWKDKGIQFEPNSALYSKEQGLNDIKLIINQLLNSNIKIWIEHGYQQDIKGFFDNNWQVTQHYDLSKNPRFINAIRIDHGKS